MKVNDAGHQRLRVRRCLRGLVIFVAAWAVHAPASAESTALAAEGRSLGLSAVAPNPASNIDPDCPYLRLAVQSPHGPQDAEQEPLREMLSSSLSRAGFAVVDADDSHYWWTSSLVLDNNVESAWSTVVRAVPEVKAGGIRFTTTYKQVDGRNVPFSGTHSLRLFDRTNALEAATLIADEIGHDLLPAVHRRCNKAVLAAARQAEAELERVRSELTAEMERVRRDQRAGSGKLKVLNLEVEIHDAPPRRVSNGNRPGPASASSEHPSPPASQGTGE
jgi:hypothetical protein